MSYVDRMYRFALASWRPQQWSVVREPRFPRSEPFVAQAECLVNYLDPAASEQEIRSLHEGVGVSSMVLPDICRANCTVSCRMAFEGLGAPAILTHVAHEGALATAMYSLVLYHGGLNLWRIVNGDHRLIGQRVEPVAPECYHEVRLQVLDNQFSVWLNGSLVFSERDEEKLEAGAVGIWAGEGLCRFQEFILVEKDMACCPGINV